MTEDAPRIVRTPIPLAHVIAIAERRFGDMTKAVVDVSLGVMAMINVRPSANNRTRRVDDPALRRRIQQVVDSLTMR